MKISGEGKSKLKASFANIALFLSIFVVLFPLAMPNVSAAGKTWYVPGDFDKIQEAIDHDSVLEGDTIFVYSGIYLEKLNVWKTLTIQGESRTNTTIQPPPLEPGTVITISAPWVNVTGFTIKNGHNGVEIIGYNNITIDGSNIENNDWSGIYLQSSQCSKIANNYISSSYWGIAFYKSNNNLIDNIVINDAWNVEITDHKDPPAGIFILESDSNYICDNPFLNNSEYGIRLEDSNWNYINNSYITNNTYGVRLDNSNNSNLSPFRHGSTEKFS